MHRDFVTYLWDIYDAADWILLFTEGLDEDIFAGLEEKQAAVERKFEIMGETITQCRQHHPQEATQLGEVQSVVDFRNYLAHRCHSVKPAIVWAIIQNDLPEIIARVKALLPVATDKE
jgi:uncharacterized protein with HEPN domain